jgi:hypothetical protein
MEEKETAARTQHAGDALRSRPLTTMPSAKPAARSDYLHQ